MKHAALSAFAVLTVWALPDGASAQQWCGAQDLNPTEITVCSDAELSRLDRQLNQVWAAADDVPLGAVSQDDWAWERDSCGTDAFCIERAYRDRIAELDRPVQLVDSLRPWCGGSTLNPTEQTICSDETLADMDAALSAIYGDALAANDDVSQQAWLASSRDSCGGDADCIEKAYLRRMVELGSTLRDR